MTWTYSGDPATCDRDAIRFTIGDTDSADELLTDEEIAYLLATCGSVQAAAINGCLTLAAKFSRLADKSIGDMSLSYSQRAANYLTLAKTLKGSLGNVAVPFAGGSTNEPIFKNDMDSYDSSRYIPETYNGVGD